MKKILYILCFGMVVGCADQLQIEPEGILTEDQVFNSSQTTEMALASAYYTYMESATGYKYMYGDITSKNLDFDNNFETDYFNPVIGTGEDFWISLYQTINVANNVIYKVALYAEYDEDLAKQYIAEAYFIRAICYLDLLKFYGDGALTANMSGLGIPLQLKPYDGTEIDEYKERATNKEVYDQIVADLTEAIPSLPSRYDSDVNTASRATISSAQALLSRVYLYMREYDLVITAANGVEAPLTSGGGVFGLENNLRVLFPTDPELQVKPFSQEDIFNLPITANESANYATSTNRGKNNLSYGYTTQYWVSQGLIDDFVVVDDQRKLKLIVEGWDTDNNLEEGFDNAGNQLYAELTTFKFGPTGEDNVPIIRLAEVYLNKAEALVNRDGMSAEAVELLNAIHLRANPTAMAYQLSDFSNADVLLNRILLERRLELMFENHERYDLIRTGRKSGLHNSDLEDAKLVLAIPQVEVDLSGGIITQNKGYL